LPSWNATDCLRCAGRDLRIDLRRVDARVPEQPADLLEIPVPLVDLHRHAATEIVRLELGSRSDVSRPARTAHAGLGITEDDFAVVVGHLVDTLKKFGVPSSAGVDVRAGRQEKLCRRRSGPRSTRRAGSSGPE
jgi:hypothetical protein